MRQRRRLRTAAVFSLIIGLLVIACLAGSVPKIPSMRTCTSVTEGPSQFEASGWTIRFDVGDTLNQLRGESGCSVQRVTQLL